jgi:RNA polymerase sigma-70 factor (ECF subfamily)
VAGATFGLEYDGNAEFCSGCDTLTGEHRREECLIEELRQGVAEAYEILLQRYQQPVYNLVYRLVDDPTDAADVVQEVFLKVFRSIGGFKGNSSLKTWIYRIAFNEAYNQRRWFNRHKKQETGLDRDDDSLSYADLLPDNAPSAFEVVAGQETMALLEQSLADMNPAFRAAVVLRDLEDLSYEEIAVVLGVSLGTVKSRILRGREALRKSFSERTKPEPVLSLQPEPVR